MRKLLLTSAGLQNKIVADQFRKFINKEEGTIHALFIPTAAVDDTAKAMLPKCRADLLSAGILDCNIDEYNLDYLLSYKELISSSLSCFLTTVYL